MKVNSNAENDVFSAIVSQLEDKTVAVNSDTALIGDGSVLDSETG